MTDEEVKKELEVATKWEIFKSLTDYIKHLGMEMYQLKKENEELKDYQQSLLNTINKLTIAVSESKEG